MVVKEVPISEFKAKRLALLEQVQKTKTPIRITRFGKPVAEVVPPPPATSADWMGSMKDRIEILGDNRLPRRLKSDAGQPLTSAAGRITGKPRHYPFRKADNLPTLVELSHPVNWGPVRAQCY